MLQELALLVYMQAEVAVRGGFIDPVCNGLSSPPWLG